MALAISASTAAAADLSLPPYRQGNAHVMERSTRYINPHNSIFQLCTGPNNYMHNAIKIDEMYCAS